MQFSSSKKGAELHREKGLLQTYIRTACRGLMITPEQFLALTSQEDREQIQAGLLPPECVRAYAESFNEGVQSRRIIFHAAVGKLLHHN